LSSRQHRAIALPAFVFVLLSATGCSGSATSDDGDASSEGADGTPVVCQVPPPVVESFPAVTTAPYALETHNSCAS
jgi:hypothetical protein